MQLGLNFSKHQSTNLLSRDGEVYYYPSFFSVEEATEYLEDFQNDIAWTEEEIVMFGKRMKVPRLTAWYGDEGAKYSYAGIDMNPLPWTKPLREIKDRIELQSSETYNSVLLNFYRNGTDSMGWHSDDEKELGQNPSIASVSFGVKRKFHLRHKQQKSESIKLELGSGSLLIMQGKTQHFWQHQVPKSKKILKPRINLTFRTVS